MSTPATTIYICSGVPLNNNYDHTIYFSSIDQQYNYFTSKVVHTFPGYTYARKSWTLKIAGTFENARKWSYLFFKNGTTGKHWYYFINNIEYISDSTVELTLELDVLQSYMFEWLLRPCYIERQHTPTDDEGANTVDEGLDTGEHITARVDTYNLSSDQVVLIASTIDLPVYQDDQSEVRRFSYVDRVLSGFSICAVESVGGIDSTVGNIIKSLEEEGKSEAVFAMWQYPKKLIDFYADPDATPGVTTSDLKRVIGSTEDQFSCGAHGLHLDGYNPKNKKLFQYPFSFMYATNNAGGSAIYKYECCTADKLTFTVNGNISPDALVRFSPTYYKGVEKNVDESITVGNFPLCAWNNDPYKLWLAQNQSSQTISYLTAGAQIIGGIGFGIASVAAGTATGGAGFLGLGAAGGMIMSGAGQIAGQLAQNKDMDVQPPQARGATSGSHMTSIGAQRLDVHHKTLDYTHAKIIDDYFTMYGYAIKSVNTPDLAARPCWTYVKTVGSNVGGGFCHADLKAINAIFDRGITFWNFDGTHGAIGNYSLNNAPVEEV